MNKRKSLAHGTNDPALWIHQDDYFSSVLMREIEHSTNIRPISCWPIDKIQTQNRNFILNTESGDFFAKVYASGSIDERIFEARVLKELRTTNNTFTTNPITDAPLLIGDAPVMIFEVINGQTLDYQKLPIKDLSTISIQIAQMHNSLRSFNPGEKQRFNVFEFEYISKFNLILTDPIIVESLKVLKHYFENINVNDIISTMIHDDLSPNNIMRTSSGDILFIDFDDMHRSYRISDIGTAIKEFIIHPIKKIDYNAISIFIEKYESVKDTPKLTKQEKKLIIPMALRRALFMYAYYRMVENEKHLTLQSKDEYDVIAAILAAGKVTK